MITPLFRLLLVVVDLYKWAVILAAVYSTLVSFGVVDTRNRMVWTIGDFLYRVTEPALRPIRRVLPDLGGIDLSPLVVILLLEYVAKPLILNLHAMLLTGSPQPLWR